MAGQGIQIRFQLLRENFIHNWTSEQKNLDLNESILYTRLLCLDNSSQILNCQGCSKNFIQMKSLKSEFVIRRRIHANG